MCSLTHSVLFLKCDLIQNKLKVEQIVHSWELYTIYNFNFQCVYASCFVYCVHSQSPHSEQHMVVFLLSLHFKDNTVCVIEHISFNSGTIILSQQLLYLQRGIYNIIRYTKTYRIINSTQEYFLNYRLILVIQYQLKPG